MGASNFKYKRLLFISLAFSFIGSTCFGNTTDKFKLPEYSKPDSIKPTIAVDSLKIANWKLDGNLVLNISQTFLENWASGGENSIASNTIDMFNVNYKKNKIEWENSLKIAGGLMKLEDDKVVKTDDRIEVTSKYGRKSSKKWNYTSQINFLTQFFPGYKNPKDTIKRSDFMSPGYFNILVGMDFKPVKILAIVMSPLSAKITILNSNFISTFDKNGAFGVPYGENARYEMGGAVELQAKGDYKKLNFYSNLKSFSNYVVKPENIDVSWELILGLKFNKFFTANVKTNLVYDDDALAKIQFREFFGLGFSYKI